MEGRCFQQIPDMPDGGFTVGRLSTDTSFEQKGEAK
jgi:hypothetical protein